MKIKINLLFVKRKIDTEPSIMFLQNLSILNFKNYQEASLSFCGKVNCLIGNNGEGKTNILDAIYYLSFCKSFFNPIDSQNILHEAPFFVIQGVFSSNEQVDEIYCGLKRNQKKQFKKNKKEYQRLSEHIGLYPVVMISPADSELITEGSESRRKFLDSVIAQFDKEYLDILIQYNKILSQRNALLKDFSRNNTFHADSIDIWNEQLIPYGEKIHQKRTLFISKFIPIFQKYYEFISGGKEQVNLEYISHLNEMSFKEKLETAIKRDIILEYTTVGIHKDDLDFTLSGFPVKKYASQGQQKSYLLALKLAQFDFIKQIKNVTPILLLDDIYDKLDDTRVQYLMELVCSDNFGQIFISDTHQNRLADLFKKNNALFKLFAIEKGQIKENVHTQDEQTQ